MNVRLQLISMLALQSLWLSPTLAGSSYQTNHFFSGFRTCANAVRELSGAPRTGSSEIRRIKRDIIDGLSAQLNDHFPVYPVSSHHDREVRLIAKNVSETQGVFRVAAWQDFMNPGTPEKESVVLYKGASRTWIPLWTGQRDAYQHQITWPTANTDWVIVSRRFSPPEGMRRTAYVVDGARSYSEIINTQTGKVLRTIVHVRKTEFDNEGPTPFFFNDKPVLAGTAVWSNSGHHFVEFDRDSLNLFTVKLVGDKVELVHEGSLNYEEALNLKRNTFNGRVLFGADLFNNFREILGQLEVDEVITAGK